MAEQETVLIIEDRRDNVRFLTRNVLNGYRVLVARDGQEGLRMALEQMPDLVIADLSVPRKSGIQVLQELRQAGHEVPVILTTFHGTEEAAVRAYQLGAQAYVIQPYTVEQMRTAVERSMAVHRLQIKHDQLVRQVAHLKRQVERGLREQTVLASIGRSVTTWQEDVWSEEAELDEAGRDEDCLWTRLVDAAVYMTRAEEGFLLLVDESSGELTMRAARGYGEKVARSFRQKVSDSLAGQVVQTGKPVIVAGTPQQDRVKIKTGYLVRALLLVPIKIAGHVIGVLSVDHMSELRAFSRHDLQLLTVLADYAALALEHARLRQALAGPGDVDSAAPAETERFEQLHGVLEGLDGYREQVRDYVESARSILTALQQQALSIETRLESLALPEARLSAALQAGQEEMHGRGWSRELAMILESISDGVLVVDETDRIVLANRAVVAMLGHSAVGLQIEGVCDDPRWLKTYHIVKAAAQLAGDAPGSDLSSATTSLSVTQRRLYASFRAKRGVPGSGPERGPLGTVIVLRDITSEREAQRAKDTFIATVSHGLRTPLTSIVGYTDLIRSGAAGSLDESQTQYMNRIRANAQRVEDLFDDLAQRMTGDSQQLQVQSERMDLTATIYEASGTMRAQMAEKDQMIELNLDPNLPHIQADPDALYHVLTNLLENAHRCSPAGARVVLHASKMLATDQEYVAISVSDRGGGIRPEDYRRVFNRYHRLDSPIVAGLGDPGVHLPIVKMLVEANGGRVWLDSKRGEGTTFTLILPAQREALTLGSQLVGSSSMR
jgi:signal transduction histidine kinase/DNA-binding response OmpR family regulator/putative methionine-R-sulfoxide reductase with GAF domain